MNLKSINSIGFSSSTNLKMTSRSLLKKYSSLRNLNTRMIRDDHSLHDMLIPGGMSAKESLIYKLTGKYPKSVTARWKQVWGADAKNVSADDELVHVHKSVLQETGYFSDLDSNKTENGNFDDLIDQVKQTGNTVKNSLKNLLDDIADKIDDIL